VVHRFFFNLHLFSGVPARVSRTPDLFFTQPFFSTFSPFCPLVDGLPDQKFPLFLPKVLAKVRQPPLKLRGDSWVFCFFFFLPPRTAANFHARSKIHGRQKQEKKASLKRNHYFPSLVNFLSLCVFFFFPVIVPLFFRFFFSRLWLPIKTFEPDLPRVGGTPITRVILFFLQPNL